MKERELIESFLRFAGKKGVELGGLVVHGFALEQTTYRPMASQDYPGLISDFIKDLAFQSLPPEAKNEFKGES